MQELKDNSKSFMLLPNNAVILKKNKSNCNIIILMFEIDIPAIKKKPEKEFTPIIIDIDKAKESGWNLPGPELDYKGEVRSNESNMLIASTKEEPNQEVSKTNFIQNNKLPGSFENEKDWI
jgi:hypothetical protein